MVAQQFNSLKFNWIGLLTDVHTTDKEGVGNIRIGFDGNIYRYVRNLTGADVVIGDVGFHGTVNTLGYFAEVFQLGQSGKGTLASSMAGIWVGTVTSGNYGWIQIRGYNPAVNVDGTTDVVVGDSLIGSSAHSYLIHDTAAGTAPTTSRTVIALAGFTTNATQSLIAGDIRCY